METDVTANRTRSAQGPAKRDGRREERSTAEEESPPGVRTARRGRERRSVGDGPGDAQALRYSVGQEEGQILKLRKAVGELQSCCSKLRSSNDALVTEVGQLKTNLQTMLGRCRVLESMQNASLEGRGGRTNKGPAREVPVNGPFRPAVPRMDRRRFATTTAELPAGGGAPKPNFCAGLDQMMPSREERSRLIFDWIPLPDSLTGGSASDIPSAAGGDTKRVLRQGATSGRRRDARPTTGPRGGARDEWRGRVEAELEDLVGRWEVVKARSLRRSTTAEVCGSRDRTAGGRNGATGPRRRGSRRPGGQGVEEERLQVARRRKRTDPSRRGTQNE